MTRRVLEPIAYITVHNLVCKKQHQSPLLILFILIQEEELVLLSTRLQTLKAL